MIRTLKEVTSKAQKEYRCMLCGCKIEVGQAYIRQTNLYDGIVDDFIAHKECRYLIQEIDKISELQDFPMEYGIDEDFYKNKDIHIHAPEAAVPKDGPSAGLAITTAIVSELTGIAIKSNVAMTGEISLKGKALAIGGLKEKSMAAYKAGCDTVIIPQDNKKDLDEISDEVKQVIDFISVKNFDEVLPIALVSRPIKKKEVKENIIVTDKTSKTNVVTQ